jgi:hypothetical protein
LGVTLIFGYAFWNAATSSMNRCRSTASVLGGRPLTVIDTVPSAAAGCSSSSPQAAVASERPATSSAPTAPRSLDLVMGRTPFLGRMTM